MNYKIVFHNTDFNDLILEYNLNELLNIPESIAKLTKNKENDLFIINTLKSCVIPHLPRDINDPSREKILQLLKEIHYLSFSIYDSNNTVIYKGSTLTEENTPLLNNEVQQTSLNVEDFNLVNLLKSKQSLEYELKTVNIQLDNELAIAWDKINQKLIELNSIKNKWEKLSANQLDIEAISIISLSQSKLSELNLPSVD